VTTYNPNIGHRCGDCNWCKDFEGSPEIGRCDLIESDHYGHIITKNHPACEFIS